MSVNVSCFIFHTTCSLFALFYHIAQLPGSTDLFRDSIDLHDTIKDEDVQKLIENLRKNRIEYFTFSSTWSSAVNTAWLFKKNGCSLEGMIEINTSHKDFHTGEYKKIPSYLFKVN